jgi:hypothetical protein
LLLAGEDANPSLTCRFTLGPSGAFSFNIPGFSPSFPGLGGACPDVFRLRGSMSPHPQAAAPRSTRHYVDFFASPDVTTTGTASRTTGAASFSPAILKDQLTFFGLLRRPPRLRCGLCRWPLWLRKSLRALPSFGRHSQNLQPVGQGVLRGRLRCAFPIISDLL